MVAVEITAELVRKVVYGVMLGMALIGHFMYTESTTYNGSTNKPSQYAVLILAMMLMMLSSVDTQILPSRFRHPARTLATMFYMVLTPTLVCELHTNVKADDSSSFQVSIRGGTIMMLMPLYAMFIIAYLPTQKPNFSTQEGIVPLVLRAVQLFGALSLIVGQFVLWSVKDLCTDMDTYSFLTPDGYILTAIIVVSSVIGGTDHEAYDLGMIAVARYVVILVPFNPFPDTNGDESKKMLGSLWMAYIGAVLIVAAGMLSSKFVRQAWTNPSAADGRVGTTGGAEGGSIVQRLLQKVKTPIMLSLSVILALSFIGAIMVWVRLPTPAKEITPTVDMKTMNYYAGAVLLVVILEMIAFLFDIWGMHLIVFIISVVLNKKIVGVYMNAPAPSGTGEGVLRGGLYLLSWISLVFPFVVPVLRRSSVIEEGVSKPIDQIFDINDPTSRRGVVIGVLALILWYFSGVEFQNSRYDQTLMITVTMVVGHVFQDADLQRIVYFAMALNVAIFMPFAPQAVSYAGLGIFVFVVALIYFALYVTTFPSPQSAAGGADASAGTAAFNGIPTFVALGAADAVSYESVADNYSGAPIAEEGGHSSTNNTEASKPLLGGAATTKEEPVGVDSPTEGYGSA